MRDVIQHAKQSIRGKGLRIVLPEGGDQRIRDAAQILRVEKLADVVLFGDEVPAAHDVDVALVLARREKMNIAMAQRLLKKPLYRAGAMVAPGEADVMLAGADNPTAR